MPVGSIMLAAWVGVAPGRVDVAGGGRVEVNAGRAPLARGSAPEAGAAFAVSPVVGVQRLTARGAGAIQFSPRFFWRVPNPLALSRPLVFGTLAAGQTHLLSPRWTYTGVASLSVGELDYTVIGTVFGDEQSQTTAAQVTNYIAANDQNTFEHRLAPRHSIGVTIGGGYNTPFGDSLGIPGGLPRSANVNGGLVYGYALSPRDALRVQLTPRYQNFSPGADFLTVETRVGWGHVAPRVQGGLDAGVVAVRVVADRVAGARERAIGVGQANVTGLWFRRSRLTLSSGVTLSSLAFFDSVRGALEPRVGGNVDVVRLDHVTPDVSFRLSGAFFTAGTRNPRLSNPMDPNSRALDETVLSGVAPLIWQINPIVSLEAGARLTARAPHLRADDFQFRQVEIWGYTAITVLVGTSPGGRPYGRLL